ncbi:hypothetical protein [Shewanella baltica]|uniref:hypothetical protein n=1 Tax=Shewanella baltica TaxID=62322 RepID=UPI00217E8A3D|nr:hypothetical protein [Shewanella baltica]MCS6204010.1 hypothetical protein [Shewanella baltica]
MKTNLATQFKPNPIYEKALEHAGKMSVKEICQLYGVEERKLRRAACYRKISLNFGRTLVQKQPWHLDEIKKLKSLSMTNTAFEVGELLGRSEASVKGKALQLGVYFMKVGENSPLAKHSNHDIELCRQLHEEGLRPFQIAEKMEIEISHLCRVLKFEARYLEIGVMA